MQGDLKNKIRGFFTFKGYYGPYKLITYFFILFIVVAFVVQPPAEVFKGLLKIITSRSLLTTDYVAVGGLGAAFLNAALSGAVTVLMLRFGKVQPNGALIMAVWLATGFSFFGKNLFNFLPITLGVFVYSKLQKEPFSNYSLISILASTMAPVVSEITFMGRFNPIIEMVAGILVGVGVGVIMPAVSSYSTRVHSGYNLYNTGFAGGIIALVLVSVAKNAGIEIQRPLHWSTGNNLFLACFLYILMFLWMLPALLSESRKTNFKALKKITKHSGRLVTDYFMLYGETAYINMGLLGMLGTTVVLVLGADLNGATIAGIFCMVGFGAFGKNIRNCLPVMLGALIASVFNAPLPGEAQNIVPILFSTGLAPIAGQFGWVWGIIAGYLHLAIVGHVGLVTGGLNLYNNGFAAGLVALLLVPIIFAWKRGGEISEDEV